MTRINRRFTRRAVVVGGAGLGVAGLASAAGWSVFGRNGNSTVPPTAVPTRSATAASTPVATALPEPRPTPSGELRVPLMRGFNLDTFDAARSGEQSLVEILGRTHSRLVAWHDTSTASLSGDLAAGWQQPAPGAIVFSLRPDAAWHERPELPGRAVDAHDVVAHLQRVVALAASGQAPLVQRAWDYASITRIEATDALTVVIATATPDPFLLQTLAGPFAFIQRPEVVPLLEADGNSLLTEHLSGSGPFMLDRQTEHGDLVLVPSPASHRAPRLAALYLRPAATGLDAFLARELDEFVARDRRDAAAASDAGMDLTGDTVFERTLLVSSMHVGSAPWKDENLRLALAAVLNRSQLADRIFGGRAVPAGLVPPSAVGFAHTPSELGAFPGYRRSHDDDIADARARLAAATAPDGPLTIDVPVIVDSLYAISAVIPALIGETLGLNAVIRPDSYVNIARRVTDGAYGNGAFATWLGWGPPVNNPDPSRALWETFHSSSASAQELGFQDPTIDPQLDRLATEFDLETRRAMVREIESALMTRAAGGILSWVQQQHDVFRQPYVSGPSPDAYELAANAHMLRVDVTHAAYPTGRPS